MSKKYKRPQAHMYVGLEDSTKLPLKNEKKKIKFLAVKKNSIYKLMYNKKENACITIIQLNDDRH